MCVAHDFLNFEASTFEMVVASTKIMGCVLGVVAMFALAIYGVVQSVTNLRWCPGKRATYQRSCFVVLTWRPRPQSGGSC